MLWGKSFLCYNYSLTLTLICLLLNCPVFGEAYLQTFSKHHEIKYKIVVIDNAGFHSTKNINVPDNIFLLNTPPYCPELNPCEKIWQYLKSRFKNHPF
ncbi:MAG: transposase [Bacteroidota bacterium]|nr:transposase [Bacteroidota bacterium]